MKMTISPPDKQPAQLNVVLVSQTPDQFGVNKPVAFILPGGPGADHTAYLNYACLEEVADLVFHDPRGCGESDRGDPSTYTMDYYIEDVEAIRQQLGVSEIIVIGKSYGSMCALGYAVRYPQHVSKLVLAAGAPSYHFIETAKLNLKKKGTPEQIAITEKLMQGTVTDSNEMLKFFQLTNSLYSVKARMQPETFDLEKKSKKFSHEVLNEGFKNVFWHFDFNENLAKITCKTLVLAGREDWVNDVKHAEYMAKHIPNSRLVVFENASHAMESDAGEEYFQHIADFIAKI